MKTEAINIRDPFVLTNEGKYYLYGTRGATCWGPATGFDVYIGTDLENWEGPVSCFENDGSFWADRNYWAPEVHPWRGAWYMFASFKNGERRRGTAILRAEKPEGPFVPWSEGSGPQEREGRENNPPARKAGAGFPVTPPDWECLDGTFYADRQGNPWIVFCHEWVQAGDGEILAMPLTEDLRTAAGEPRLLFRASEADWVKAVRHSSGITGYVTDGPFLWRDRVGRLLCLWSSISDSGYTQGLAVSDSGEIDGHFSQLPPLFREDGGHGMLFRDRAGRTVLTLHRPNEHLKEHPVFLPVEGL